MSRRRDFDHYATRVAQQAFAFVSAGAASMRESGGGTLIQVTGGSSRRAIAGRGPWAAGAFAARALTQSAALELRDEGIHVALLIVDATIKSPKTAAYTKDAGEHDLADQREIARAVEYLASQDPTAWTHGAADHAARRPVARYLTVTVSVIETGCSAQKIWYLPGFLKR